jgi:hypothetical protein
MPERKLRIVRKSPPPVIGVCERCNAEFKSTELSWDDADAEIAEVFAAHKCKLTDNALRIVREFTEGK